MTPDDNSTSPPWLQNHGVDVAAEKDDPNSKPAHDDEQADDATARAEGDAPPVADAEPAESDAASEPEQAAGIFPPVPDSIEQTTFAPQFGQEQFGPFSPPQPGGEPGPFAPGSPYPPNQGFPSGGFPPPEHGGPFAPPGEQGQFPPPGEPGQFAPPGEPGRFPPPGGFGEQGQFPPPGNFGEQGHFPQPGGFNQFPPPEQGQFAPPGEQGQFPPHGEQGYFPPPGEQGQFPPATGQFPSAEATEKFSSAPGEQNAFPPSYGEVRQETPYGEVRQEIGADGMVRRVFDEDQPPAPQPSPEPQGGGEQFSWAPPPLPPQAAPPQPSYQQQPIRDNWQGGPPPSVQQHQPGGYQQPPQLPGPPGQSMNELNLLKRARRSPRSGWRKAVHKVTGGTINPGESPADVVHRELVERVNQPVRGDYRIAILSLKGGVGKTTTTVGLGSTFASSRGDRVIAIDANPDLGTLAHRVPRQTRSTVRNLLEDQHISRYSDVRAHTSQAPSRLEVLASEQDPAVSEAFSEADYRRAINILQQFYNIILTDCGTGLMHSAMKGVLDLASSLILVTSPAIDGARSASATLDWLEHHGYRKLVERTVVVVNASRRGASTVDLDQLRKLFLDRTRAVQVVPFDDHLAEGAEIDLELVGKPTRTALLELAAMVADDFGYHVPQPPFPGPHTQYSGPQPGYPGAQTQYPGQDPYPSYDRYQGQ
ncbi:nucleotide-binding protein [Nocardia blacklockiae]|uniref:nucleotide-binding protein n=1 Tax=Nocardia blacklockiae TaxID=480036 RepID=UPI001893C9B5|nr:AAA family ATPase [Nocardia blacklockiae]MBF6173320.1 AAA family ATPase [Nocardia blacklockiae]